MSTDLLVQGYDRGDDISAPDDFEELFGSQVRYRPLTQVTTRAGGARGAQRDVSVDGADSDVLEIETADGLSTFMTVAQARRKATERGTRQIEDLFGAARGGGPVVGVTRSSFDLTDPEISGALGELADSLRGLSAERAAKALLSPAARAAMTRIAAWIDRPVADGAPDAVRRKKAKRRGLYRVEEDLVLEPNLFVEKPPELDKPALLLLHGTFSHTEAAFGGLRGRRGWSDLCREYDGRMFALEHATLSKTPVENAVDLARLLPAKAKLHIVSHSRGGLVGEALSLTKAHLDARVALDLGRYERAVADIDADKRDVMAPDIKQLRTLLEIVRERELEVERFVRVACPARGTILASRRVDKYASYLFNLLKLVPGLQGTGVVEVVKLLLLTFLDQRSDVRAVPGLEAQMPESPFIGTLNAPPRAVLADDGLAVIAGDVEGSGLVKRLKVLGADLFFREDHDMVVNTAAMTQGVPRLNPSVALFKGPAYSHSNYFTDEASSTAVRRWLLAPSLASVGGFEPLVATPTPRSTSRGSVPSAKVGTVVVVPDLMGSQVKVGEDVRWPGVGPTAALLDLSEPRTTPALVGQYDALVAALKTMYDVRSFTYDFCQGLATTTDLFNTWLRRELASGRHAKPVHLVAHGVGCRIVLDAEAAEQSAMNRVTGHRILLSPPLAGTWTAKARVCGRDALSAMLAMVDGATPKDVGSILREKCPALEELAPPAARAAGDRAALPAGYRAVFGRAAYTWTGSEGDDDGLALTAWGDGHVAFGELPDGLNAHRLSVPFDQLVADKAALGLIMKLLATDDVGRPLGENDSDPLKAPEIFPAVFPTADDLVWASMGGPIAGERDRKTLEVSVVHGNLTGAKEKLIVGTQYGTPMAGSEKALDERLEGALSRHRLLGQYPGQLGTCQLFVRPERAGAGAAIIGIGDPGDLSPGALTAGVAQAVLRLVAAQQRDGEPDELELATVLIGTSGPGGMVVASAVGAAITGVRRANRRISDLGLSQHVGKLKIYELYEDRAIEALQAAVLLRPSATTDGDDALLIEELLVEGTDGRTGTARSGHHADRWRTIRVSGLTPPEGENGLRDLSFTETGRSAGAATLVTRAQHRLIETLVEQSIGSPTVDEQIYNTLYELLVPRSMKGQGRPSEHIMYMLDEHAASLPFEMLATRSFDDGVVPIAIEVGMIRRLESTRIRELVRPSPGRKALVVGDPYIGADARRLGGAVREANAVANLLEARGWEVRRLISRDAKDQSVDTPAVLNALFSHEYRIIHIAAHGVYDAERPERSGVCIGPGDYLTSHEFEQMQTTPDLVFLNCCHLGSGIGRPDRLASSVSRKLIDNGIRAVVAAGWAVDDAAASRFATRFYDNLLAGGNLGSATLSARSDVYAAFGSATNTWGAYQVYGEPAFQLERQVAVAASSDPTSRRALRDQLDALAQRAMSACAADEPELRTALDKAGACGRERNWLQGSEHQAIGEVWRALGDYDKAITAYNDALSAGGAAAGFDVIAQLIGAHAYQAADHLRLGRHGPDADHFDRAEELLASWRDLSRPPSDERLKDPALMKAAANLKQQLLWRRVAQGRNRAGLAAALLGVSRAYAEAAGAFTQLGAPRSKDVQYTRLAEEAFAWLAELNGAPRAPIEDGLTPEKRLRAILTEAEDAPWSSAPFERVRVADAKLALHVVTGTPLAADVVAAYTSVFRKGVSKRERDTILHWVELVERCLPRNDPRHQPLQEIAEALSDWVEVPRTTQ